MKHSAISHVKDVRSLVISVPKEMKDTKKG